MTKHDEYTPRPKASQAVAAAKRARQATDDRPTVAVAAAALPFMPIALIAAAVLLIGMLSYGLSSTPALPLQVPPAPTEARHVFAPVPTNAPAPSTAPAPTDPPTALPTVPPAAPVPAEPPPQTGQGMPADQGNTDTWEPTAEPPPPEPTAAPVQTWPTSAPAVVTDFEKPDIQGTCQFVGCLGAKAVDLARAKACHALYWQYGDADPEDIPELDYSAVRGCVWEGLYK